MKVLVCVESTGDKFDKGQQLYMQSMSPVGSAFATDMKGQHLTFLPARTPHQFYCATVGCSQNDPKYLFDLIEA